MKNFDFFNDLRIIKRKFDIDQNSFSSILGISRSSFNRIKVDQEFPNFNVIENFYSFVYEKRKEIGNLNKIKSDFLEDDKNGKILLFQGAKEQINGSIDVLHSNPPVDFGCGFYVGETYEQSATWVASYLHGSVYSFYFDKRNLKGKEIDVSIEWMIAILFYRGRLEEYKNSPLIKNIINDIEQYDYIVAPIADNNMYKTLEMYGQKLITDEQCSHALSATNLGKQYVFIKQKACENLINQSRLYLCRAEKNDLLKAKELSDEERIKKAELALEQYRRKGKYIDELFK